MKLEDILNVPSLSVSLKTATELGFNPGDENSRSFFMSDEKKSQGGGYLRQKTNINDSYYLNYYDEASMIKEVPHDQEEESESN